MSRSTGRVPRGSWRRLIGASALALSVLPCTAQAATTARLPTTCNLPAVDGAAFAATITATIPTVAPTGTNLRGAPLRVDVDFGQDGALALRTLYAADSFSAVAKLPLTFRPPGSATPVTVTSSLAAARTTVPSSRTPISSFPVAFPGTLASFTPTVPGLTAVTATTPSVYSLLARRANGTTITGLGTTTDSDRSTTTFDVTCTQVTAPVANIAVYTAGGPVPTAPPQPTPPPAPTPTPTPIPTPAPPVQVAGQCVWPLIDQQPTRLTFTPHLPASVSPGATVPSTPVDVSVAGLGDTWLLMELIAAEQMRSEATLSGRYVSPDGTTKSFAVPFRFADADVPLVDPGTAGFVLRGNAWLPSTTFSGTGTAAVLLDGLRINGLLTSFGTPIELGIAGDSDRRTDTFDLPCQSLAGQRLTGVTVVAGAPAPAPAPSPTPGPAPMPSPIPLPTPTPTPAPASSVTIRSTCWWPLVGDGTLELTLTPHYPAQVKPGVTVPSYPVDVSVRHTGNPWVWMQTVGAERLSSALITRVRIDEAASSMYGPVTTRLADIAIPATDPGAAGLVQTGTLWLPAWTYTQSGAAAITIETVLFNNRATDPDGGPVVLGDTRDSDGDANTFDILCPSAPATRLNAVTVSNTAPALPAPGLPTPAPSPLPTPRPVAG